MLFSKNRNTIKSMKKPEAILNTKANLNGDIIYCNLSVVKDSYALHFHEFYELELPIEGEGYEIINGERQNISLDTCFIFQPTDYHEIKATSPLKILNIAFVREVIDEDLINDFLLYEHETVLKLTPHKLQQVRSMLEIMVAIYSSQRSNKDIILQHLLNALLLTIVGSDTFVHKLQRSSNKSNSELLKYINDNFARNPTLDELASFCHYQKNYFCEYFKRLTGMTYKEYLSNIKINYSKKLLKSTNKSIKEIAIECGFNSANNYIRKFKEITKSTPKNFRKVYFQSKRNY